VVVVCVWRATRMQLTLVGEVNLYVLID
jgi:hypothetical protein